MGDVGSERPHLSPFAERVRAEREERMSHTIKMMRIVRGVRVRFKAGKFSLPRNGTVDRIEIHDGVVRRITIDGDRIRTRNLSWVKVLSYT